MRILIATDIPYVYACGSSTFLRGLTHRLADRGHAVMLMNPSRSLANETYREGEVTVAGVRSYSSVMQKTFRIVPPLFIGGPIRRFITDFRPDVIHIQSQFMIPQFALAVARAQGIATVGTNHFVPENVTPFLPPLFRHGVERLLWKHLHWLFNKCDVVTMPTRTAADIFEKSNFPKPVRAISNGVNFERFQQPGDTERIRRTYKIPSGPLLLSVGRVDAEKHIDVVVRALPQALSHTPFTFVIAGRGSHERALRALVSELKLNRHVVFTGFIADEDLAGLYQTADVYVNAGTAELQCIAALEAMSAGRPVLLADALALPELVPNEKNGFLFAPGNSEELAGKIVRILTDSDLRSAMGAASLALALHHDVNQITTEFLQAYQDARNMHRS